MKIWKRILSIVLVCALVCPTIIMNANASDSKDDSYWFSDDFSYAAEDLSSMGWTNQNNILLDEVNGKLEVGKDGGTSNSPYTYLGGNSGVLGNWKNYTVQADVTITDNELTTNGSGRFAGLVVAAPANTTSAATGYEFMICNQINTNTGEVTKMYCSLKDRTGSNKNSSDITCDIEIGKTYTLKMEVTDSQIFCYIDDKLMITYDYQGTDVNPFVGTIGLHSGKNIAEFDNICVRSNESAPWFIENYDNNATTTTLENKGWTHLEYFTVTDYFTEDSVDNVYFVGTTGAKHTYYNAADANNWSNYTVEADVIITDDVLNANNTGRFASIAVGADGSSSATTNSGYEFMLTYKPADGKVYYGIKDRENTSSGTSDVAYCEYVADQKYTLRMVLNGNLISCYIDNKCVIENHQINVEGDVTGTVGLYSGGNVAIFDNVCVKSSGANPWYNERYDNNVTSTTLENDGWTHLSNFSVQDYFPEDAVDNVVLVGTTGAKHTYYNTAEANNWSNYTVEADVIITDDVLNANNTGRFASIAVGADGSSGASTNSGYEFMLTYKPADGKVYYGIKDRENTSSGTSDVAYCEYVADQKYTLRMVLNGNLLSCFIDGKCVIKEHKINVDGDVIGTIGLYSGGNVAIFDNVSVRPTIQCENNYYNVSFYRSNRGTESAPYIHPYKEGYVFGGWYTDAAYKEPLAEDAVTGSAYAKWVDEKVLSAVVQLPLSLINADLEKGTKTTIRFLSTVDCHDYQKVGFYIQGEGGSPKVHESTTVYSSIRATVEGTEVTYQPNDERYFSKDSVSFITYSLTNVPVNSNTIDKLIAVTPYWVTADGTITMGITRDANNKPITLGAVIDYLKESTELFYDDFAADTLNSRWTKYSVGNQTSEAILENEQLHLTHPEGYVEGTNIYYMSYVSGGENWKNYTVSADVLMEDVANLKEQTIAITARQSGQTRYEFRLTYDGSDITGYLRRYKGSSGTVIGAYKPTLMNGVLEAGKVIGLDTSYNLKMSLKGNCIRIYLDGQLIDTFYDESEDALTAGTAGIYLANSSVYVDNFKVVADYNTSIESVTIADCTDNTINLYQGHDINAWQKELEITYADTTKGRIQLLPEMIGDFDNTVLGIQDVVLTYRGVESNIVVNISERPEYLTAFEEAVNAFADTVTQDNLNAFYELQNTYDDLSNYEIAQLDESVVTKYTNLYQTMELLLYPEINGISLLHDGSLDKQSAKNWDDGREQYVGKWAAVNDLFYYLQRPYRTMGTGYHSPNVYGNINMVSTDMMLLNKHMYGGVILNWSEDGYCQLRVNSIEVDEYGNANYRLQLSVYDGDEQNYVAWCYLSDKGITLNQNEWFNLCLTYVDGQLNGYVNGSLVLSYDDSEGICMTEGECAARISDGDALVDNFRVYGTEIEQAKSEAEIEPTYYIDDFEDETVGTSPSHWVENTEWNNLVDNWSVQSISGSKVYGTAAQEEYSATYLHVFEKNPEYTVRFMTDNISGNGTFGFLTRLSPETAYVKVGYDATSSKWYICSQRAESEGETIVYSDAFSMQKGTWYTAHVVEQGATVSLYINDKLIVQTESAVEVSPGRLGFYVEGASMYVDDVNCIFENGDVPQDGIVSYDIKPENAYTYMEVEAIDESTLVGLVSNRKFLSTDAGLTWSDITNDTEWQGLVSDGYYKSVVKLHDGTWLQIRTQASSQGVMDEDDLSVWVSDDFKNWTRVGRVIEDSDITYGPAGESSPFIHVSTATEIQLDDGTWRIFCPVASRRYEGSSFGIYTTVYYSDDGGVTWKKSANDTTAVQPGAADDVLTQWSESKIIKGSDGVVRMYCSRNHYGCMVYTESYDGGVTWENMIPIPELQCAMSSFGVYEDPTEPGTFYMAWVNSTEGHYTTSMWPRTRLCLARSYDGKTWEFLTNIEWMGDTNSPFNGVPLYQCLDPSVFVTEDYVYIMHGRSSRENTLYTYSAHQLQNMHYTRIEKDKLTARAWDATTLCDVDYPVKIEYVEDYGPTTTFELTSSFTVGDNVKIKITCLSGHTYEEDFKKNCTVWKEPTINWDNRGTTQTVWVTYKNGYDLSYDIYVKNLLE